MKIGSLVITDSYGDTYKTKVGLILNYHPPKSVARETYDILWDNGIIDEYVSPDWIRPIQTRVAVYNS